MKEPLGENLTVETGFLKEMWWRIARWWRLMKRQWLLSSMAKRKRPSGEVAMQWMLAKVWQ
ncbi:unnamed protein product, partial [Ilex paraguariensis]